MKLMVTFPNFTILQGRLKYEKFVNYLRKCQDFEKICAPWNKLATFMIFSKRPYLSTGQHIVTFLVNNELDEYLFFLVYIYSSFLNVSNTSVFIIRRINCIDTTFGICHSM
jgi:hypothetical protein